MLLIIHESLAELQKAQLHTVLHFSIFMGQQVESPQLFAFKSSLQVFESKMLTKYKKTNNYSKVWVMNRKITNL